MSHQAQLSRLPGGAENQRVPEVQPAQPVSDSLSPDCNSRNSLHNKQVWGFVPRSLLDVLRDYSLQIWGTIWD